MKKRLVEIIYHQLEVRDFNAYQQKFKTADLLIQEIARYFEVHTFKSAKFSGDFNSQSVTYHFTQKRFFKLILPLAFHLKIKDLRPDIVLVHGTFNYFQIVHLKWLLGKNCNLMVQHHGERPRFFIKRWLLQWSAFFVDAYLFTSRDTAIELHLPAGKIKTIMEGSTNFEPLNRIKCREELGLKREDRIYLWVGRLINIKNPLFFLKAFNQFSKANPEAKLFLFYHDTTLLNECKAITSQNNAIQFMGRASSAELIKWYSAADYFVSASLHEGSGYALCEAMACGCIPLIPSIGAFKFMTNNGTSGMMYEAENEEALKITLQNSLSSSLEKRREEVQEQFKNRLSFEAIAKDLLLITESL